jgi:hypothetical protein
LKEQKLADTLVNACGLDKKLSTDAHHALNWRSGATTKKAGNFSAVMQQVLICAQPYLSLQ